MEATTRKLIRDYGGTVLGAVGVALLIRFFVIEAYRIPSSAMRPTLEPGDTVFVVKAPLGVYLFAGSEPKRGDVVLFRPDGTASQEYLKRIVGMPGETIQLKGGKLSLNGQTLLDEIKKEGNCGKQDFPDRIQVPVCYEPPVIEDFGPVKIPAGSVFVLGDFRSGFQADPALRGKSWGTIPAHWIKGRALWLWLSVEPSTSSEMGVSAGRFPKLRFERMFRRIQ